MLVEFKDLQRSLISSGDKVKSVMKSLDESGLGICLLVDRSTNKLLATVTDGDLRRGMMSGMSVDDQASKLGNPAFISAPSDLGLSAYSSIAKVNQIAHVPILSDERVLLGLFIIKQSNEHVSSSSLVIMAGGLGSRLRPLTNTLPKPMLSVGGRPIIDSIIEKAFEDGFRDITVSLGYLGHLIRQHLGDGSRFGVNIDYIHEDSPLGTAGALSLKRFEHNNIVVTNGDIVSDIRFSDVLSFHTINQASATMVVRRHELTNPYGVVEADGINISSFVEKPTYVSFVNAGIYAISTPCLDLLVSNQYCDMPSFFEMLRADKGLSTIICPMHESWIDIGMPADLELARLAYG